MRDFRTALDYHKKICKMVVKLRCVDILAISTAKLVDALDKVADQQFGEAALDIWNASAAMLKMLVESIPKYKSHVHTESISQLDKAIEYLAKGEYERATFMFLSSMRGNPEIDKYRIWEFIDEA